MSASLLLVSLTALGAAIPAAAPTSAEALPARLDAVVDMALRERRIVGAVVLVARNGEVVYRRAAGLADREQSQPMRTDTLFRLSSVTKPIVVVAAMRLVAQGRLPLDAPVTRWLPEFVPRLPDGSAATITVRQLLTHTAGLAYGFNEAPGSAYHRLGVSDGLDASGLSLEDNLRRLAQAPLAYTPGTHWRYSLATDVLGAVIARAAGQSLRQLVREQVTVPLAMTDTDFVATDASRLAVPYVDAVPQPRRMRANDCVPMPDAADRCVRFAPSRALDAQAYPSGGAGMVGSAGDVLRLLEMLRRGGDSLLGSDTVAAMMSAQVGADAQTQGPGWGFGYLGAVLVDPVAAATPQAAGTVQWGGVYGHTWFIDRTHGLSVVILTNTAFEGVFGAFPNQVRDAVYGP